MKAMILAAGRGERMKPLTDHTPKPLLKVAGKALIDYNLEKLAAAGYTDIVINIAHLGRQIQTHCGRGERWGLTITFSDEGEAALETAGGIAQALSLLGDQPFLVINADIICDFPLADLKNRPLDLAHLVMIDNPRHHAHGDFGLSTTGWLCQQQAGTLTYSGIGVYHPQLFKDIPPGPLKLRPVLNEAIRQGRISAEKHGGLWMDVGSPERLREIEQILMSNA